jgi:hypothetical protein
MTGSKSEGMMCSIPTVFAMVSHRTHESTSREQQQRTAEVIIDRQELKMLRTQRFGFEHICEWENNCRCLAGAIGLRCTSASSLLKLRSSL